MVPEVYTAAGVGAVLDIPGPVALPAGQENPSRERARHFLFAQTLHTHPTAWRPDFNGVGTEQVEGSWLEEISKLDPLVSDSPPEVVFIPDFVETVVVHKRGLGSRFRQTLSLVEAQEFRATAQDEERVLLRRSALENDIP